MEEKDYSWVAGIIYVLVVLAVIAWMFLGEHSYHVWNVEEGCLPSYP